MSEVAHPNLSSLLSTNDCTQLAHKTTPAEKQPEGSYGRPRPIRNVAHVSHIFFLVSFQVISLTSTPPYKDESDVPAEGQTREEWYMYTRVAQGPIDR